MKVLFFADPNSVHDIKWLNQLAEKGITGVVVCRDHQYLQYRKNEKTTNLNKVFKIYGIAEFSFSGWVTTLKTIFKIRRIIQDEQIQVVHFIYAQPNVLWAPFIGNVPYGISTRGSDVLIDLPFVFNKKGWLFSILKRIYTYSFKHAMFITSTSTKQKEAIKQLFKNTVEVKIVRTGIPVVPLETVKSEYFPSPLHGVKYVFLPRMMRPLYHHEFTIQAFALMSRDIKDTFSLVLIDKNSKDLEYVHKVELLLKENGISYIFLEQLSQLQMFEIYRNAGLVVMNPLSDGTPNSALEAMLLGIPVLFGPVELDTDLFNEQTIEQLQEWDITEMAQKMERLLKYGQERDKLEKAKELVRQEVALTAQVERLIELYNKSGRNFHLH